MIIKLIFVMAMLAMSIDGELRLRDPCNPEDQKQGYNSEKNEMKVCPGFHYHGSFCNPKTKICSCGDTHDPHNGNISNIRTYQDGECRLLPGSDCLLDTDYEYYRCVKGAVCVQTRKGIDPKDCPPDSPVHCDTGDFICVCGKGKQCLTKKIETPKKA